MTRVGLQRHGGGGDSQEESKTGKHECIMYVKT